jgi:hypothetical protein
LLHVDVGNSKNDHISSPHQLRASKGNPLIFNCTAPTLKDTNRKSTSRRFAEHSSTEFLSRHMSCFQNGHTHLSSLALLLVNRQVHQEARSIPYAYNTFAFLSRSSLMQFATDVLRPFQAEALRNIVVWVPLADVPSRQQTATATTTAADAQGGVKTWQVNMGGLEPLAMQRLSGLLNIDIKISIFHGYLRWISNLGAADAWKDGLGIAGLLDLKGLPLRNVKVSVAEEDRGNCFCCGRPGQILQSADVTHYAEGVRRQILGVS